MEFGTLEKFDLKMWIFITSQKEVLFESVDRSHSLYGIFSNVWLQSFQLIYSSSLQIWISFTCCRDLNPFPSKKRWPILKFCKRYSPERQKTSLYKGLHCRPWTRNQNVRGLYVLLKLYCRVRQQPLKYVEPDRWQIQAWTSFRSRLRVVPSTKR